MIELLVCIYLLGFAAFTVWISPTVANGPQLARMFGLSLAWPLMAAFVVGVALVRKA